MNETVTTRPALDLAAEASNQPLELALIGLIGALALAYLVRGFLRKRRRTLSGEGCGDCAGCASAGSTCKVVPPSTVRPADKAP